MEKKDIKNIALPELEKEMEALGEKKFRAKQLYEWIHKKLAMEFEEMTSLSRPLRERLEAQYRLEQVKCLETLVSKDRSTVKYLFLLPSDQETGNGNVIESVLMKYRHGNSVCISSQAGCRMGCKFRHGTDASIQKFKLVLEKEHINVTIRREMGTDINAACGQLRKSYMEKQKG